MVETDVHHIRAKLGVRSRAAIAAWAVERGLAARDAVAQLWTKSGQVRMVGRACGFRLFSADVQAASAALQLPNSTAYLA
jgi:hypothetical protein